MLQQSQLEVCRRLRESCCVVRSFPEAKNPLLVRPLQIHPKGAAAAAAAASAAAAAGAAGAAGSGSGEAAAAAAEAATALFELPDGTTVDCSGIRTAVAELLFKPDEALTAMQPFVGSDTNIIKEDIAGFAGITHVQIGSRV